MSQGLWTAELPPLLLTWVIKEGPLGFCNQQGGPSGGLLCSQLSLIWASYFNSIATLRATIYPFKGYWVLLRTRIFYVRKPNAFAGSG